MAPRQEREPRGTAHPLLNPYHSPFHLNFTLLLLTLTTGKVIHEMLGEGLFSSLFPVT